MGYEENAPIYVNPQPQQQYAPAPYTNNKDCPNYTPVYTAVQPTYAPPSYEPGHTHVVVVKPNQNNLPLGFACGIFCGIFGLCCLLAVEEKTSYLKGWAIAFVILLFLGAIIAFLSLQ